MMVIAMAKVLMTVVVVMMMMMTIKAENSK